MPGPAKLSFEFSYRTRYDGIRTLRPDQAGWEFASRAQLGPDRRGRRCDLNCLVVSAHNSPNWMEGLVRR